MNRLLNRLLQEPRTRNLPVDGVEFTLAHREILKQKPQTRRVFEGFYRLALDLEREHCRASTGLRWEIGSGAGFLSEFEPGIVASDIKPLPFLDHVCSADALPVKDGAVRTVFAFNVFHHLPSPAAFFREMIRVVAPGGVVILVEPGDGPLARVVFPRLFASEGYDLDATSWESAVDAGPMSKANQAQSSIVFKRDRARFEREFPELELVTTKPHAHIAFLGSGGINFRALIPSWLMPGVLLGEKLMAPLDPLLGLQQAIVLRRR